MGARFRRFGSVTSQYAIKKNNFGRDLITSLRTVS
jgi:hypothetical protein